MPLSQRIRNRRNNLNKNRLHSPFSNMSPNIITQQQKQYQNNSFSNLRGAGVGKVNNLDLINGIDNRYESRHSRSKMYPQNGYNRHETKL